MKTATAAILPNTEKLFKQFVRCFIYPFNPQLPLIYLEYTHVYPFTLSGEDEKRQNTHNNKAGEREMSGQGL